MDQLTQEQLSSARRAALISAKELVADAELLLQHERYARAFSVAILACEESCKIPILAHTQWLVAGGAPVDWKRFHRRLRSHTSKLMAAVAIDEAVSQTLRDTADLDIVKTASLLDIGKQKGFYMSLEKGAWKLPSQTITPSAAQEAVKGVAAHVGYLEHMEDIHFGRTEVAYDRRDLKNFSRVVGWYLELRDS